MRHDNFKTLSGNSTKLLIDLLSQFKGKNNGDLCATWSLMRERGWNSRGTLAKALKDLLNRGWLIKTRQGGKHQASLYGITWMPVDDCDGKLDIAPTLIAADDWKDPEKIKKPAPYEGHINTTVVPIHKNNEEKAA